MIRDRRRPRPPVAAILALLSFLAPAGARADDAALLAARVADAQKLVAEVRGVGFRAPVASALLPEKDLEAVLARKLVEDLPVPFETYVATLAALGLVAPDPDLLARLTRLYTRQVVGYYDPAEKRFYIVPERAREAAGPAGDLMERILLAHELTHALQDQRLGLDRRMKALRESTDALLALQAFLEGEATLLMTDALLAGVPEEARQAFGDDPVDQILDGLAASSTVDGAEGVPEFFVKQLVFPYVAGTAWVRQRKREGGWPAVDAVYGNLPSTTRQILRPGAAPEIAEVLEVPAAAVQEALALLPARLAERDSGLVVREVGRGWRLYTRPDLHPSLERFAASTTAATRRRSTTASSKRDLAVAVSPSWR